MCNGKSAVKSAKKAYVLSKDPIFCKVYAQALFQDNHKAEAKNILIDLSKSEKIVKKHLEESSENDYSYMEELQFRDPRNAKLALGLMKYYIETKKVDKAIQIGNRHIEFRGRSVEVRDLLEKIIY